MQTTTVYYGNLVFGMQLWCFLCIVAFFIQYPFNSENPDIFLSLLKDELTRLHCIVFALNQEFIR